MSVIIVGRPTEVSERRAFQTRYGRQETVSFRLLQDGLDPDGYKDSFEVAGPHIDAVEAAAINDETLVLEVYATPVRAKSADKKDWCKFQVRGIH